MKTEPFLYWLIVSLMVLAMLMYLCSPSKILRRNSLTPANQLSAAASYTEGRILVRRCEGWPGYRESFEGMAPLDCGSGYDILEVVRARDFRNRE